VVEYAEVLAACADSTWGSVTQPCVMPRCWRHNNIVLVLAVVLHPVIGSLLDCRDQPRACSVHACKLCCNLHVIVLPFEAMLMCTSNSQADGRQAHPGLSGPAPSAV
jgi:hypothetical protein